MRGAGLTRGARTLYDIRDGSLFPDMNLGSVQPGLPFDVDWEAFRSGWDRASNGGSKEGMMMELNTSVLSGHADRWVRKLYKLDQVSHHFCLPVIFPCICSSLGSPHAEIFHRLGNASFSCMHVWCNPVMLRLDPGRAHSQTTHQILI